MSHRKWDPPSLIKKKVTSYKKIDLEQEKKDAYDHGYSQAQKEFAQLADHTNEKQALANLLESINKEFSNIKQGLKTELEGLLKDCLSRLDAQEDKNAVLVTMRKQQITEAINLLKHHSSGNKLVMTLNPTDKDFIPTEIKEELVVEYDESIPRSCAKLASDSTIINIDSLEQ